MSEDAGEAVDEGGQSEGKPHRSHPLLKLCALWEGKTKDNKYKLSGNMGEVHVMIMGNDRKTKDSQPDFYMYVTRRVAYGKKQGFSPESLPEAPAF